MQIFTSFKERIKRFLCIYSIRGNNAIYLTFDDGPEPEITEYVLELLEKNHAKATFFCTGKNIQKYPLLFRKIVDDGHSIGSHTMTHLKGESTSLIKYYKEVEEFYRKYNTKFFRPPYGSLTLMQLILIRLLGVRIILWSHDSKDWCSNDDNLYDTSSILDGICGGSIILFHFSNENQQRTKLILPLLMKEIERRGFNFDKL